MKRFVSNIIAMVLCVSCCIADADEKLDFAQIGMTEQSQIREIFYRDFSPYIKSYVSVFSAQDACKYDFINDNEFNDMADMVIKKLVSLIEIKLRQSLLADIKNSADLRVYLSNYIAVGMIDAQASIFTETSNIDYANKNQCAAHAEMNKENFKKLKSQFSIITSQY